MILKNIFRRKARSLMVIAAVVVATSLLISMLSMAGGIVKAVDRVLNTDLQDVVITADGSRSMRDGHLLSEELEDKGDIATASPVLYSLFGQVHVYLPGAHRTISPLIQGMIPGDVELFLPGGIESMEGGFSMEEDLHYDGGSYDGPWSGEALVNKGTASKFDLQLGDVVYFDNGEENRSYTIRGIVDIGLTGTGLLGSIYILAIPLSELQDLLNLDVDANSGEVLDLVDNLVLTLDDDIRTDPAATDKLVQSLEGEYPLYYFLTKEGMQENLEEQVSTTRGFYLALGAVSVSIGLLFVACIMIMSVFERMKEIGLMRAIGTSRGGIFGLVFTESLVLVALGAAIGIIPGYYGSLILEGLVTESLGITVTLLSFDARTIATAMLVVVSAGSIASIYPAWIATRMKVVEALRQVR